MPKTFRPLKEREVETDVFIWAAQTLRTQKELPERSRSLHAPKMHYTFVPRHAKVVVMDRRMDRSASQHLVIRVLVSSTLEAHSFVFR
jgi:hypothetical protein